MTDGRLAVIAEDASVGVPRLHIVLDLRSVMYVGLWRKLYDCSLHHFTTSQMYPKLCSIHIFVKLQPFG